MTKLQVRDHLSKKRNINVKLSDIEKLPTVSKVNAFKVSVPKDKLDQAITGWPPNIKAEPYSSEKPIIYAAHTTRGNQGPKGKNRNQWFLKQQPRVGPKYSYWDTTNNSDWRDQYSFRQNGRY